MWSCLYVQPAQHRHKCSFKCPCPDPSCSLQDKLPPLLSIQARALTLWAGWHARIGWSFINVRQSCTTAHPSFPLLPSNPPTRFDLSIRRGRSTADRPPLQPHPPAQSPHPPRRCELRGRHKSYCPASELRGGGGGWDREGSRRRRKQEKPTWVREKRLLRLTKLVMKKRSILTIHFQTKI